MKIDYSIHQWFTLVIMLLFGAVNIQAANVYLEQSYYQDAYSIGNGKIHFKQLIFAEGSMHNYFAGMGGKCVGGESDDGKTVDGSNSFYKLDGNSVAIVVFEADNHKNKPGEENNWPRDKGWVKFKVITGMVQVTNDYEGVKPIFTADGEWHELGLKRSDSGDHMTYFEYDWFPPVDLDNKQFELYSGITRHRSNDYDNPWSRIEFMLGNFYGATPDQSPILSTPFFYAANNNGTAGYGKLAIVYNNMQDIFRYYTSINDTYYPCIERSGMMFFDARDTVVGGYRVCFETLRSSDNTTKIWRWSNKVDIPAYHRIYDFKVGGYYHNNGGIDVVNYRYKQISWKIYYPKATDIIEGDMFEIQRAYHSDYSDAVTIQTMPMSYDSTLTFEDKQIYVAIDSTEGAWWNPVEKSYKIYYRVRRASSSIWGWEGHNYAAKGYCQELVDDANLHYSPYYMMDDMLNGLLPAHSATYDADMPKNNKIDITIRLQNTFGIRNVPDNKLNTTHNARYSKTYLNEHQRLMIRTIHQESNDTFEVEIPFDTIKAAYDQAFYGSSESTIDVSPIEIKYQISVNSPCTHYIFQAYIDTTGAILPRTNNIKVFTLEQRKRENGTETVQKDLLYFTEAANIASFTGSKGDYPDYVLLTWEATEGDVGTYSLETRANEDDEWLLLASDLTDNWYNDSNANPKTSAEWEYRLTMRYTCNGNEKISSATTKGSRSPYGRVNGYILYSDGSGCSNIDVVATRVSDGAIVQKVTTDDNGEYILDSLIYKDEVEYAITPTSQTAEFRYNNTAATYATIRLSANHCVAEHINFDNISSVRISGRVLYENSTIPVRHANFLLNGRIVKKGDNNYETDALGNFEFEVPKGSVFTLQVVRDGHKFDSNGYVRINDSEQLTLIKAQDGIRIFDQTKIRLVGRLAGGNEQADKPIGFGLSTNNLGDDLRLVLELEGDNISQIVHLKDDPSRETLDFTIGGTKTQYQRKRIIIEPDPKTGEYAADVFPVEYKITQATAKGYATLFANGKTSETIDLNDSIYLDTVKYEGREFVFNASYCITYHSPITISCKQLKYGSELDYYGELTMERSNIMDKVVTVPLAEKQSDGKYKYLFGAPVFNMGKYQFRISAHEDYYYNNDLTSARHEEVRIKDGLLKVYNGLYDSINTQVFTKKLDGKGQAEIEIPINYVSFIKTGDSALRVLDLSVEYKGAYIECQPFKAFIAGNKSKGKEFLSSTHGKVVLLDVLRDPPGSNSYSWIETGSSYTYNYTFDTNLKMGAQINLGYGTRTNLSMGSYSGNAAAGVYAGTVADLTTTNSFSLPIHTSYFYKHSGSYTFTTSDRIETSSEPYYVGKYGDVFIGAVQNVYYGETDAVKPIDSITYAALSGRMSYGTMKIVKEGKDSKGKHWYLVIGIETEIGNYINSTFVYTHEYIENDLVMRLKQKRNNLLLTCDSTNATQIANITNSVVYWSRIPASNENFASEGTYRMIYPEGSKTEKDNEVASYNRQIADWLNLLHLDEAEKLAALHGSRGKKIANWSISGGTKITHNESYDYNNSYVSRFDLPGGSLGFSQGVIDAYKNIFGPTVATLAQQAFNKNTKNYDNDGNEIGNKTPIEVVNSAGETKFTFDITPIFSFDLNRDPSNGSGRTRKTGYSLHPDQYGYMDVAVYRVANKDNTFNQGAAETIKFTNASDSLYGSYVFFLNGGASRCPYEDADSTQYLTPKLPLSAGTLNLENQKIDIDVHERSNVPIDQPAIFNLKITNEAETDFGRVLGPMYFYLRIKEGSNPKGAKIYIDGLPLTGDAREIKIYHGEVINKTMEVYAGEGYDFEDIEIRLSSTCDPFNKARCTFSVHYIPVSCPVNISTPHNNWIMNTLSPKDSTGWYLPIVIDGFDVNYKNFDHIELQYKLSTQSDDAWVNLCSYYNSVELYDEASGNKALISNGRIENIRFYGERDPIEQQYDLRAVSFCRHGNGYITRSSEIRRGIKDTRPPRVFGQPEPADAILGVGDNLKLRFNEAIAGNYLDEDNNFQILGSTNDLGLTAATSVHFNGSTNSYAQTLIKRNLAKQSFSIDMTIKPTKTGSEQILFEHGGDRNGYVFGLSADNRLYLRIDTGAANIVYSKPLEPITAMTRVICTYDNQSGQLHFYAGTKDMTDPDVKADIDYNTNAPLIFGRRFDGNMMEVRLWGKALSQSEIAQTNMKRLTGYEYKLIDYYPMNEGRGTTIADKSSGATLHMQGATWNIQEGLSLTFAADQRLKLNSDLLSRSAEQDVSFMIWFKTSSANANIFSAGRSDDKHGMQISIDNNMLILHSDSDEWQLGNYSDNKWHHLSLTVNRIFNTASVFVDGMLSQSFAATKLCGISGEMYIGGSGFEGGIDDIMMFEQALPKHIITNFDNMAPHGNEMGLMAYLPFSQRKANSNDIIETIFSPNDQRIFTDANGNNTNKILPLIIQYDEQTVKNMVNKSDYAPIREHESLTKLKFDWAFNGDELLININMPEREINKQMVYITVRDVEDLNGNPMKSPVMWAAQVDHNSLKWAEASVSLTDIYGEENGTKFEATIINTSGLYHQYTIEALPDWLTAKQTYGTLESQEIKTIEMQTKPGMAVGTYSEIIYLTDENGLREPLKIDYEVVAFCPWNDIDKSKFDNSMSLRGQVIIENEDGTSYIDTDSEDIVAAFCNGMLVGKAKNSFDNTTNQSYVYMTIYGNAEMKSEKLNFKLWRASTGRIYMLAPTNSVKYTNDGTVGISPAEPVRLLMAIGETQQIELKKGWNWMSLNINPLSTKLDDLLLQENGWAEGDIVKSSNDRNFATLVVTDLMPLWIGTLDNMTYSQMYMVRPSSDLLLYVEGKRLTDQQRTVTLKRGWNSLPYLLDEPTMVKDALADYFDKASLGDIVKSKDQFAAFTENGKWEGSLQTMYPGQGYLLKRNASGTVKMQYIKNPNARRAPQQQDTYQSNPDAATNMTMIAQIAEQQSLTADNQDVMVYIADQLAGRATATTIDGNTYYFITISASEQNNSAALTYRLESGETLYAESQINYQADSHYGTLRMPIMLHASTSDNDDITYPAIVRYYAYTGQLIGELHNVQSEEQVRSYLNTIAPISGIYSIMINSNGKIKTLKIKK